MKRKIAMGLAVALLVLLAVGVFRSQELTEPPEPPGPPEIFFGEGRPRLGVSLRDVTPEKARELKLPAEVGAIVIEVDKDSPASKAGLLKNDVILEFSGERVRSVAHLRRLVRETPAGRTVALQLSRGGQTRSLSVKLEPAESHFTIRGPEIHIPEFQGPDLYFNIFTPGATLGISGDDLTSQLAEYFGVKQGKGVLVREVMAGSAAEKAGLKAGDIIVRVDDTEVKTVSDLRHALPRDFEGKRKVTLTIVRDHHEQTLPVELERSGRGEYREITAGEHFGLDSEELRRLQAEARAQAAGAQKLAQQAQREVQAQQQKLHKEYRRQMEGQQRRLKEQLKEIEKVRVVAGENEVI
jgi:predicted metalloprotease with PDZ domain